MATPHALGPPGTGAAPEPEQVSAALRRWLAGSSAARWLTSRRRPG
ncbi:MAG: hypothetical protein WAK82_07820 [Streptosporangiaceae bacterium]